MTDTTEVTNQWAELTADELLDRYTRLRDALRMADDRHKQKTAPAREMMDSMEAEMLDRLNKLKVDSVKSKVFGTFYKTHTKSATLADPSAFKDYVIANAKWELADWKANATAVADFIQEHDGNVPPGVNYRVTWKVGVRKGKGESET